MYKIEKGAGGACEFVAIWIKWLGNIFEYFIVRATVCVNVASLFVCDREQEKGVDRMTQQQLQLSSVRLLHTHTNSTKKKSQDVQLARHI